MVAILYLNSEVHFVELIIIQIEKQYLVVKMRILALEIIDCHQILGIMKANMLLYREAKV
jgi:hypothetical protein